jgi:DNA-binding transcriptional LysR family regulator
VDRLDGLRVFVAVAEAQGFASAARKLGLSAPAVTRAVMALEQRLGAQLFQRTTRVVRLTDAGERFLEDCRRVLADLDEAEAAAGGAFAAPQGRLGVTASAMFGRVHVAPIVLDFLAQHPRVTVHAFFVDRIVSLLDEGFDVAVRIAHLPDSTLTAVRVGSVRRVTVASPDYLARRGTPKKPADLARHDAIAFSQTGNAGPAWTYHPPGSKRKADRVVAEPRIQLVTNSTDVAIAAALAGRGIIRALSYQVQPELAAGRLRLVLPWMEPPPIPVHLVVPSGRKTAAKVRAFVDFAADRLRRDPVLRESG